MYSPAACWPIAANGKVFIVAPDRVMTALDAKTGEQLWRASAYNVRESIGLSQNQTRDGRAALARQRLQRARIHRPVAGSNPLLRPGGGGFLLRFLHLRHAPRQGLATPDRKSTR